MNNEKQICIYGCGKEAKFQLKNGKWCCSKSSNSCLVNKKKLTEIRNRSEQIEKHRNYKLKYFSNLENKKKNKETQNSFEVKKKQSEKRTKYWSNPENRKKASEIQNRPETIKKQRDAWTEERREKQRKYMLNGGALRSNKFVKSPSKPQIKLYNLIKEIYPAAEIEHWEDTVSKRIDIGIKDLMIAIEYDGSYWHQDKEKDNNRQKKLEALGWKFIRYVDYIPSKEQVNNDIKELINVSR